MTLLLLSLFSTGIKASNELGEVALPTILKPDSLDEGTERILSDSQIAELIPWARDSKMFLSDLIDSTQGLSISDKIERLEFGLKQVIKDSTRSNSELFMRYVLNRAIIIKNTLDSEMDNSVVGSEDVKLRVLLSSIKMSINYYDADMSNLAKKSSPDFKKFAEEYFVFLSELNKSIFDASAQYFVQRISLEWLQWDLYRDINNARHAPKIIKINNALKMSSKEKQSDAQYIRNIQHLKRISLQLEILPKNVSSIVENFDNLSINEAREKFTYSNYSFRCYKRNPNGETNYTEAINNRYCANKNKFQFVSQTRECYKMSFNDDIMWGDRVSLSDCHRQ